MVVNKIKQIICPLSIRFDFSPFWIQIQDFPLNWRRISIVKKITEKVGEVLELNQYSLTNGLTRSIRIKIRFNFGRVLVLVMQISLSDKVLSSKEVWLDLSMSICCVFCFHYGMLIHKTKMCIFGSSLNVDFEGKNSNFRELLRADLNLPTPMHIKGVVSTSSGVDDAFTHSTEYGYK